MESKRLVPMNVHHGGMKDLRDALYLIAREIESGFLAMDAIPGEDYTRKDLMKMALDFAISGEEYSIETTVYE
ncbi:hypothetical protein [Gracilimonas mengyeensis]|uniref:Uncharacterized protein n=1 Tax=Gracilimonas mengyeensis TaxID=1302730 RepID=A0A521CQR4_9BACT|nr:hypothetical protein [Gracilimonas mengyeensis]SMO61797.1 hypothetical protein SAMN06265219_10673 [Gracilimonas mengyeensis]